MSSPAKSPKAEWRRPCDIMKLHRRKRKSSLGGMVQRRRDSSSQEQALHDSTNLKSHSGKRRNPFGCAKDDLPLAKKHNSCQRDEDNSIAVDSPPVQPSEWQCSSNLFEALDKSDKALHSDMVKEKEIQFMQRPCKVTRTDEDVPQPRQTTEPKGSGSERRGQLGTGWSRGDEPPIDWCLKQKVRFMSPKSFSWCCTLKSLEEAQGLNDFITKLKEPKVDITECGQSSGKEFQRSIMYWIHPSLPWVKLFPRMTGDNNRVSRAALMTTDDDVLAALRTDWAESFTSAFYLVRARYCPYIYLCAHQFTAMFLTTGTQQETLRGVVTPTTRGFREALANEGIEFTLPLLEKQRVDSEGNSVENGVEKKESGTGDEDLDNEDDTAASVWLESIGLNKANFPSLDPNKVKIQRECFRAIDNRPQSLVHVEGSNVQALFNFLLNWRSCVASSGPQTGLPPTILSPVGFRGATLKSLKVKQSSVKQQDEAGVVTSYGVLEMSGPILPQNLQAISQLFKSTQDGEYTATFHNHEATVPFNAAIHSSTQGNDNASPPHQSITTELNTDTQGTPQTGTVKELEFSRSKFFWKCY